MNEKAVIYMVRRNDEKDIDTNDKKLDNIMLDQAGCAGDCTGMIPSAPQSRFELENYNGIRRFSVSEIRRGIQ